MSLVVVGLSHHTGPIELRERLAFPEAALPGALLRLRKGLEDAGAVILSTCNRVEVYVNHLAPSEELHHAVRAFLSAERGVPEEEFREVLYEYAGRDTVGHLFRVASGLDSLVVGEGQILGQVHDAYLLAQAEQATDKTINVLFERAFSIAKAVRTESNIGAGKVSVSSVAVDLAASIFMELAGKTVLVIGSGETGELALRSLMAKGVSRVIVANRSAERARELASRFHGQAVALDDLDTQLHRADIVISSTAAPDFVLHPDHFQRALKRRGQEPMFVIDIAVPRDIDPAVNALDNVYLYDIDDLQQVADANLAARRDEIAKCMAIVDRGVDRFCNWLRGLEAEPTIVSMARELDAIREEELAKTLKALPDLTEGQRKEVEYLTRRIVNTILQRPMSQIKWEITHHDPGTVIHLVKRLFGLKDS